MPRTLLIIDDNKAVRDSLRFLILRKGYAVVVADAGAAGIALAAQTHIDGALVDVHMPGMNGIEVCRALRAQAAAAGKEVAVWIMTGARTPILERQALEAGARFVLGKPFDFSDMFRRFEAEWGPPDPPKKTADPLDEL